MKPHKLIIEGVNSFFERVEIDFTKLLQNGIFGIFGNTGSGKSSILDSIMLALYGNITRAKKKEDFINNRSKKAYVLYEFEILTNDGRKTFEIEREFSLDKVNKYKDSKAKLLEIKAEGKFVIAEGSVEVNEEISKNIIGLDMKEFQRCIALPQGEFASFVSSQRADRLSIIAKLFNLEEYGEYLQNRVKYIIDECREKIGKIDSKLEIYENITQDKIKENELILKDSKNKYNEDLKCLAELKKKNLEISKDAENFKEYDKVVLILQNLENESKLIQEKQEKINKSNNIKAIIDFNDAYEKNLKNKESIIENIKYNENLLEIENQNSSRFKEIDALKIEIEQINVKIGESKNIELDFIKRAEHNKDIAKLQDEYRAKIDDKTKLLKEIEDFKNKIDVLLKSLKEDAVEDYFSHYVEAIKNNAINSQIENEKLFIGGVLKKDLTLKNLFNIRLFELERQKQALEINKSLSNIEVDDLIKKLQENEAEKKRILLIKERAYDLNNQKTISCGKLEQLEEKILQIQENGKKHREEINYLTEKIINVLGIDADPSMILKNSTQKKNNLDKELKKLEEDFNKSENIKTELLTELKNLNINLNNVKKDCDEAKEILNKGLQENNILNIESLKLLHLDDETVKLYQICIENYNQNKVIAENDLKRLKDLLLNKNRAIINGSDLEFEIKSLEDKNENAIKDITLLTQEIENDKVDLAIKKKLIQEKIEPQTKLNNAEKLYLLVKSKKFMEFTEEEYLTDITNSANKTLSNLTSGRYRLQYADDFYILDNLNGGKSRSVATLSGGETFLVSLSLAISLSEAIVSFSRHPIEFFFLDEGFGTLDGDLIDVVIESLEKLKCSHFYIGLISHVPELKQRIESKILVTSATETSGSKIEIVY